MTSGLDSKGLHNLSPSKGATKARKRIGRGPGSGTGGHTVGRGQKGLKSRSGGKVRAGFEGGQMPLYMRVAKLRGSNKKMSMPMGPFRTHTLPVNVEQLSVFEAGTEVTPELLKQAGNLKHLKHPVKVLGNGDLSVKLSVTVHAVSASAREKIEAAGGTVSLIEGPKPHGRELAKIERTAARAAAGKGAAAAGRAAEEKAADAAAASKAPAADATETDEA
jgi:large subunit ribosomal protein L15